MDDLTLRYYEAEMRYLREAGKEFARAHPDRAAMLNLDKPGACDPSVERLFEGFAFLMGRLREKLDDDLPELTEGLVSLLWPHYMRTIPSLAIVEFSPDWRSLRQAEILAEGFSVLSRPVGPHKTACQYRTTRDVLLQPLHLADARLHTESDGRSAIRLRFECPEKVDWSKAGIDKVAIFLNAEAPVSAALHLAMTRRVHAMYARHAGTYTGRHQFDGWCRPMGFDDNDCLWK
ncbi:TPA: type VI secretion system baseplate subunit TssF, partial [Escherichia coli]|nr:type VI secretion system baseplate subunit TssF [Escherichia coli]